MAVDVETQPEFRAGSPQELFEANYKSSSDRDYVAADGERFAVVIDGSTDGARQEINVVINWHEELKQRVPIE